MKRITVEMLKQVDACEEQVELFEQVFPSGAPVSMRSLMKAKKGGTGCILCRAPSRGASLGRVREGSGASLGRVREGRGASLGEGPRRPRCLI